MLQITIKLQKTISISQINSISALGNLSETIWENYKTEATYFQKKEFSGKNIWVSPVSSDIDKQINTLKEERSSYKYLD